jgi:nicotinate phosphoribosyltransferase
MQGDCGCGRADRRAIGTGSHLPDSWRETYATADVVEYDGEEMVKIGREFLTKRKRAANGDGQSL